MTPPPGSAKMEEMLVPIVGREPVLAQIASAVGLADGTVQSAVLLGGDAGIGKTRVVTETVARAEAAGVRVLVGHCLDLGGTVPSFQPAAEALGGTAGVELDLPADGERLRTDVMAEVARTLERLAAESPVLLVLEDLHWADASTRHLVRYLLSRRFTRPVALLATYRSDDLHRRHPLRSAIAEWTRLPSVRRIDLEPLDDVAMTDLLRSHAADVTDHDGLTAIVTRAEGNAFYAEELLEAGRGAGELPGDLADLLLVRVDRLGPDALALVTAVACAGGLVSDVLLRRVVAPGTDVDGGLREAVDLKVLAPVGEELGFRHALLAEAVRDDLLPGERRAVHAAYLAALEADPGLGSPAALALHAHAAGDLATAFVADVAAASNASRVGGHDEAAAHLERALSIVEHAPDGYDVVGLVADTVDALVTAGHVRAATTLVEHHLEGQHPPADRARLLLAAGHVVFLSGPDEASDAASLRAVDLAPDADARTRARIESLRATVAAAHHLDDEATERAERAVRLAEQIGDLTTASEAQTTLVKVFARSGDDEKTRRRYAELVEAARARGDASAELRSLHYLAFVDFNAGRLDAASRTFAEVVARAHVTGREWAPYGFDGRFFGAVTEYLRGDWDEVLRLCRDHVGAPRFVRACLDAVALLVQAGRGERPDVSDLDELRARWDQDEALAVHSGTALIDLADGPEEAIRAHDDLRDELDAVWREVLGPQRLRMGGLLVGRLAGAVGRVPSADRPRLFALAQEALAAAESAAEAFPQLGPEGRAWRVRLRAEVARLHWLGGSETDIAPLEAIWREAVAEFAAFGEPYELARSQVRLAHVLLAAGRGAEAAGPIAAAEQVALRLGARPLMAEIETLGAPARTAVGPVALTPREREVLALVADGRSNGEVASQLFISTKTASVHVSNILAKLGASSRTEAAAIARRDGLLDS